jgi:hypothetical protein
VKGHRRIARPSIFDAKRDFDFHMSVFAGEPSTAHYEAVRASERRNMRKRIRTLIGRLRERDRIYDELHLIELDSLMTAEARSDVVQQRSGHLPPPASMMQSRRSEGYLRRGISSPLR